MHLFAKSSLEIEPTERIIFLYPKGRADGSSRGTIVSGNVRLHLIKATQVAHVAVTLLCKANVRSSQRESSGTLLRLVSTIPIDARLALGTYSWAYTFTLDPSACWSARPAITHGSITYLIQAKATTNGLLGDLHATDSPFYVISSATEEGSRPTPLDLHTEECTRELGPLSLTWSSPRFTQASVFCTELNIVAPRTTVIVHNASIWIQEKIRFRHFDRNGRLEDDTVSDSNEQCISKLKGKLDARHTSIYVCDEPLADAEFPMSLACGLSFRLKHFCRVPHSPIHQGRDAPTCKYSTPPECNAPICPSHELTLKLNFELEGKMLQLVVTKPVIIGSCLLITSNAFPPDYDHQVGTSRLSADGLEVRRIQSRNILVSDWGSRAEERCSCSLSFEAALEECKRGLPTDDTLASQANYKAVEVEESLPAAIGVGGKGLVVR